MVKSVVPILAILAAAIATWLWFGILNGGDRDSVRATDEAIAATGGDPAAGREVIVAAGCAACHEVSGIDDPKGHVGPPLTDLKDRQFIAGRLANSPQNLTLWIEHPRSVDPQTAMPELGLTHKQARDAAAYLYNPK